jgi:hypothetical protein
MSPVLPTRDAIGVDRNPAASVQQGPKKETARVSAPGPSINMTKTQPLILPAAAVQPVPVVLTSAPVDALDTIPRSFCWALLGIAVLIFLIQIWNYVVS